MVAGMENNWYTTSRTEKPGVQKNGDSIVDIKQISYFMAIAREESFSRAAEKLGVSQPTLSMAVKKLEEELHVQLFYSFNRKQLLTDEGIRLHTGAQKILETYQETVEAVTNFNEASSGVVTLGLSPLFGACFFGNILPSFSEAYPNIKINMIEDGAKKIDELVEKGEVDIAVTLSSDRPPIFESCHFSTQRNVALLHKSHRLAGAKSLTVADLRDESFAIFNHDFLLHYKILAACHASGFYPKIVLLSSQWDFMVEIVSCNRGISILPKPVLDKHPDPNVACIPLVDRMKYWDIVLIWNRQKHMSKACHTFLQYLQENLPADEL